MNTALAIILIAVIVVAGIAAWVFIRKRRSTALRSRFGPEYDHAVQEYGDRSHAERALEQRAERTEKYRIRTLSRDEQHRFSEDWRRTQARFVDDPGLAIREADDLVCQVMRARGYPMAEFDRRAEDISVDHPRVVRNYRAAHRIAGDAGAGRTSTEEMRQAMVHYRELFEELLETQPATAPERR
ncbi:MAG TPA: hypothetical protein VMJ75_00405 [Candidatus Acidoferrales bacterium]|nr:hypothetical protein [Candidatus Acidoferrales bacterium]